jgi:hypothetical protein
VPKEAGCGVRGIAYRLLILLKELGGRVALDLRHEADKHWSERQTTRSAEGPRYPLGLSAAAAAQVPACCGGAAFEL